MKDPKRYEPLSPRKIFAFGKLNQRNVVNVIIIKNKKLAKSLFPFKLLTKNKFIRIVNEWNVNNPLYPSTKLAPLITNKKHKQN